MKIKLTVFKGAVKKLCDIGTIELLADPRTDSVRKRTDSVHYGTGRDGTNGTNERDGHKDNPPLSVVGDTDVEINLGRMWMEYAHGKTKVRGKDWDLPGFVSGIRLIKKKFDLNDQKCVQLFEFMKADDFWQDKCFHPRTLTKKSNGNGCYKGENLISALKRHHGIDKKDKIIAAASVVERNLAARAGAEKK